MKYFKKIFYLFRYFLFFIFGFISFEGSVWAEPLISEFWNLKRGMDSFPAIKHNWGMQNIIFLQDDIDQSIYMRVSVPKGAIDPATMSRRGLPRGGAGFKSMVVASGSDRAVFSYRVRFPSEFQFVRGGKLPGLYGGAGNSGGVIPNGTDGFSFRLMWGKDGAGEVYAYLPSSITYGTGFFRGKFRFVPGTWHQITQELQLNTPNKSNGTLRLWFDGIFVGEQTDLLIRTVETLKINGFFFDVFFGGGDDSFAPPADTYLDFSNFRMIAY